jgi:GT2 family glycosyltransferase
MTERTAQPPTAVGVVIVTYNSADELDACLQSLASYNLSVVVVDNASTDGTPGVAKRHGVDLLANTRNRGFAAAVNQGVRFLSTPFLLVLNPDVRLTQSPLALLHLFERHQIAAVAASLVGADGMPQSEFQFRRFPTAAVLCLEALGVNRLWPGNPANRRYRYHNADWGAAAAVDQPAGAFLMIRRTAWERVGGLDERFFPLWFEDVDFCLRLWRNHFEIWRVPIVAGIHAGGHSIRNLEPGQRQLYWYRSLLHYAAKHFSGIWVRIIALSILLGSLARAVVRMAPMRQSPRAKKVWPTVALATYAFISGRPQSPQPETGSAGDRQET